MEKGMRMKGNLSMFRKLVLLMLVFVLGLSACSSSKPGNGAGVLTHIRLPMGYIPSVQFAPFYVAVEKGYFRDAGIELEFDYSFETDGMALVGAGKLPFAIVSGEQVPLAREQGLPVKYVMAWYQDYPVSIVAKSNAGIKTAQDLKGKKIGLPGLFGATYVGLRAFLFASGLKESDVTLDSVGYNQVEALVSDQEQAVVVYTSNEPVQLRAQNVDITELRVSDAAKLASNGVVTNEKTIKENPELVRAFISAMLKGLKDVIANPNEALQLSKTYIPNYKDLDPKVQEQVLDISIGMWKADKLGESNAKSWDNMKNVLLDMGLITKSFDVNAAYTNEFLP
jgi:putative riboflavin transport system substrate-binding protein